jgi:outer membrane protein OmpA-like peptidoglycan-associated protein
MASTLGESEETIPRGVESALATVMGGMASHSDDPNMLRRSLDLMPAGKGDLSWSNLTGSITDPNSPLMSTGKRIVSTLFGGSENMISRALGTGIGMQPRATSSLLAMAAPMVMGFLGRRVRDEGMSMQGLGGLLQREIPAIRSALPAGVTDLLFPRERVATATPVVAQTVTRERHGASWLPLLLLLLIPAFWWGLHHRRPVVHVVTPPPATTGTANRAIPETHPMAPPANLSKKKVVLYFDTGSSNLKANSAADLDRFTAGLSADQKARVNVDGYTDNVGNAASNVQLSQQRADAVKGDLVEKGIAADRITAKGYGDESPIADNVTAHGRELNRRVTVEAGE